MCVCMYVCVCVDNILYWFVFPWRWFYDEPKDVNEVKQLLLHETCVQLDVELCEPTKCLVFLQALAHIISTF